MLNKTEILKEIKKLMNFSDEKNFVEAKSGENIVRVEGEDFVVGQTISVVTPDGVIPAPDGEHILEDGRKLTTEGGIITEIELPEPGSEPEVEVELAEITPEEKEQEKDSALKKMEDAEKKIEEMEKKILDMEDVIKEMVKSYGAVKDFSKSVELKINDFIKGTPAEEHFSDVKSGWKAEIKERKSTETDALQKIHNIRKKS